MRKRFLFIVILLIIISFVAINGFNAFINIKDDEISDDNNVDIVEEIEEEVVPDPVEINLLAVGDIMFHSPQIQSGRTHENEYDFNPMFKYVKPYIQDADLSLANFETVTVPDRPYTGYPSFNSPVESIEALSETGFNVLSTANNHSLDQGKAGITSTIEEIDKNGMEYIGTSLDRNPEPLIIDVEGIEIGVLSYTYGLNGLESFLTSDELSYMINLIDEEKIQEEIQILKDNNVDLIVSYIHWGNEYQHEPTEYQQTLGRNMVDWGVNIVFGSHPHVLQRSEVIEKDGKDNLIVYSMGNFLSNQREITMGNSYAEDGVMVNVNVEKDFTTEETIIKDIDYIPTWVYRYGDSSKYYYDILPTEEVINGELDINLDSSVMQRVEKSYNDVMGVFGD